MDCNSFNFKKQLALSATIQGKIDGLTTQDAMSYANRLWAMNNYSYPEGERIDELLRFIPKNITAGTMGDLLLIASDVYQNSHNKESFLEYRNRYNIDNVYNTLLEMHTENISSGKETDVVYWGLGGAFSVDFSDNFKDVGAIPTDEQQYAIKKRIADELMPLFNQNHIDFIKSFLSWVNDKPESGSNRMDDAFIKSKFKNLSVSEKFLEYLASVTNLSVNSSAYTVETFLNTFGRDLGINRDAILNGDFDTTNTIVMMHSDPNEDTKIISLFTLSPTGLAQAGMNLNGRSLFHNFLPLNDFTKLSEDMATGMQYADLAMANNVGELERLKLSMLAIAIGKDMKNARMSNIAVLKINNTSRDVRIDTRWVSIGEMIKRLKTLGTIKTWTDSLTPGLKSLFNDVQNLNTDKFERDYLVELYSYMLEDMEYSSRMYKSNDKLDTYINDDDLRLVEDLRSGQDNPEGMLTLLNKIIDIIRNKRANTKQSKLNDNIYQVAIKLRRYYNDSQQAMRDKVESTSKFNEMTTVIPKMKHNLLQMLAGKLREIGTKIDIRFLQYREKGKEMFKMLDDDWKSRNIGSEVYERLYNKPEHRIDRLKKMEWAYDFTSKKFVKQWLYRIHHTLTDPETKALYDQGKISDDELKFAAWAVAQIKEKMVDVFKSQIKKKEPTISNEDAEKYAIQRYNQNWSDGLLPLFMKSTGEYFRQGKVGKALQRMWTNNKWYMEDGAMAIVGDLVQDDISAVSIFYQQYVNSPNSYFGGSYRMDRLGIQLPSNNDELLRQMQKEHPQEYESYKNRIVPVIHSRFSEKSNKMIYSTDAFSSNMESIMDQFVYDSLFKEHMDTEGVQVYQDFQDIVASDYAKKASEKTLVDVGSHLWMRFGQRQRPSDKESGAYQNVAAFTNMMYKVTRDVGVSLSIPVALTSFTANTIETSLDIIARQFGNPKKLFLLEDYYKGAMYCARNFGHIEAIMDKYGLVNRSKEALLNDTRKKVTNKGWANEVILHLLNFMTDYKARSEAIISQMIHDGALGAESYVDGKSVYDWTKDKRWEGEDGKLKLEAHKRRLRLDNIPGSFDEQGNPLRAYSLSDIQKLKLIGDEIVGAYDSENKVLALDYLWVYVASQFRNFMWTKMPQRFYWGEKELDVWAYDDIEIDDETGEKKVVRIKPVEHGTFYGLIHNVIGPRLKLVNSPHGINKSSKLSEQDRYDVARASLDMLVWGFVASIFIAMKIAAGDEEKKKKRTAVTGLANLGIFMSLLKGFNSYFLLNPAAIIDMYMEIPMLGTAKRMYRTLTGQATWGEVRRLTPGGGTIKMAYDINTYLNNSVNNDSNGLT